MEVYSLQIDIQHLLVVVLVGVAGEVVVLLLYVGQNLYQFWDMLAVLIHEEVLVLVVA